MTGIKVNIEGRQVVVADLTPPGVIAEFGGNVIPAGWLLCDGTSYLNSAYPALQAVIGTAFGAPDGSHFNVPDLRGQFLRGVDGSAGIDQDKAARVALKPGGNIGNAAGSSQGCKTHAPLVPFTSPATTSGTDSPDHTHGQYTQGIYGSNAGNYQSTTQTSNGASVRHTHSTPAIPISGGGDSETRPTNLYVNYIIKF